MAKVRIERQIQGVSGLSEADISRIIAKEARSTVRTLISQDRFNPIYEKWVDGRQGAEEETVKHDGVIIYEASYWPEVVKFAMDYAVRRSPEDSGNYRRAWVAMVNGALWPSDDYTDIPHDAYIWITNTSPYHRKIDVGGMRVEVPPHIVEDIRRAVLMRFKGLVNARVSHLHLSGPGTHPEYPRLPYFLKRQGYRKSGGRKGPRKDMPIGQQITYPTLVMNI